jgi:hypothetical protein
VTRRVSSASRLRRGIETGRRRLAKGERLLYHVTWTVAAGGAIDVTVSELPIIHLFVPDPSSVIDGARVLIARTLAADPRSIDVVLAGR